MVSVHSDTNVLHYHSNDICCIVGIHVSITKYTHMYTLLALLYAIWLVYSLHVYLRDSVASYVESYQILNHNIVFTKLVYSSGCKRI